MEGVVASVGMVGMVGLQTLEGMVTSRSTSS
jgi:hypothetical protein